MMDQGWKKKATLHLKYYSGKAIDHYIVYFNISVCDQVKHGRGLEKLTILLPSHSMSEFGNHNVHVYSCVRLVLYWFYALYMYIALIINKL